MASCVPETGGFEQRLQEVSALFGCSEEIRRAIISTLLAPKFEVEDIIEKTGTLTKAQIDQILQRLTELSADYPSEEECKEQPARLFFLKKIFENRKGKLQPVEDFGLEPEQAVHALNWLSEAEEDVKNCVEGYFEAEDGKAKLSAERVEKYLNKLTRFIDRIIERKCKENELVKDEWSDFSKIYFLIYIVSQLSVIISIEVQKKMKQKYAGSSLFTYNEEEGDIPVESVAEDLKQAHNTLITVMVLQVMSKELSNYFSDGEKKEVIARLREILMAVLKKMESFPPGVTKALEQTAVNASLEINNLRTYADLGLNLEPEEEPERAEFKLPEKPAYCFAFFEVDKGEIVKDQAECSRAYGKRQLTVSSSKMSRESHKHVPSFAATSVENEFGGRDYQLNKNPCTLLSPTKAGEYYYAVCGAEVISDYGLKIQSVFIQVLERENLMEVFKSHNIKARIINIASLMSNETGLFEGFYAVCTLAEINKMELADDSRVIEVPLETVQLLTNMEYELPNVEPGQLRLIRFNKEDNKRGCNIPRISPALALNQPPNVLAA